MIFDLSRDEDVCFTHPILDTELSRQIVVNTLIADTLAPCIARLSAAMILTIKVSKAFTFFSESEIW